MKYTFLLFLLVQLISNIYGSSIILDQNNWNNMMTGEWMVVFHAPWCPACRSTMPGWRTFGDKVTKGSMMLEVGEVDITESPALTGIFLISQLPTIIHVKEGEIRSYNGGRTPEELMEYVRDKMWVKTEPIPWYYSPNTIHMRALGVLLRISIYVRDISRYLTEQQGFPTWLAYVTIGCSTLMIGVGIGLILVLVCDFCCPPRPQIKLLLGGERQVPEPGFSSDNDNDSDVISDEIDNEELEEVDQTEGKGDEAADGDQPPEPTNEISSTDTKDEDEKDEKEAAECETRRRVE